MTKEQWANLVAKANECGIVLDMQKVSEARRIKIRRMSKKGPLFVDYTRLMR